MDDIKIGLKYKFEKTVTENDTADKLGSGTLEVFSTPMMVALMELAAKDTVSPYLPEGHSTVGTALNIKHIAATKVGKKVWAIAELIEVDRKKLVFNILAFDEDKQIGEGTHERFIVDNNKFLSKI